MTIHAMSSDLKVELIAALFSNVPVADFLGYVDYIHSFRNF